MKKSFIVISLMLCACGVGSDGVTAKNPRGQVVSGIVCCGLIKGRTIRF